MSDKRVKEVRVGNPRRDATCQTQNTLMNILSPLPIFVKRKPVLQKSRREEWFLDTLAHRIYTHRQKGKRQRPHATRLGTLEDPPSGPELDAGVNNV